MTTPGGTAVVTNGFTVLTLPTITSASPSQADQGETSTSPSPARISSE